MWVWGCVGLCGAPRGSCYWTFADLQPTPSSTGHNPNMVQMTSNSICLAFLCQHCTFRSFRAPLLADILTISDIFWPSKFWSSRIWKLSSKPDRASQENVKGGRPKCHVSSFETPPNSKAIRTIWIWDIVAQTYVLRLQSLHSFWRPLALHHSLAAWSTMAQLTESTASCSHIMSYPGHEPISTT
jgi:hypothetical protein